jgi:NAD(P)-dependent dehydrogenase (short-subunit alcohol dehydrogenase family)
MTKKTGLIIGSIAAAAVAAGFFLKRKRIPLTGKVVLITGGSRGLGLALAREFGAQGCHLALCARSEAELRKASEDLKNTGADVLTIVCDVTNRQSVEGMISQVLGHYSRVDVLVNNAGLIQVGPVDVLTVEDFEQAMDVMFWGPVYTTLALLPWMQAHGEGRIVNITSIGAKVPVPHLLPYCCAKFAAAAFSEGLAAELRRSGIRVVTIAPGLMRTGSHLNALFKGQREAESAWFSLGASLPGISMSAKRAARQIVASTQCGRAERILSTPANFLARFHGLFPGLTTEILALVNRVMPQGTDREPLRAADTAVIRKPWMSALTVLGQRAAREYLQPQ